MLKQSWRFSMIEAVLNTTLFNMSRYCETVGFWKCKEGDLCSKLFKYTIHFKWNKDCKSCIKKNNSGSLPSFYRHWRRSITPPILIRHISALCLFVSFKTVHFLFEWFSILFDCKAGRVLFVAHLIQLFAQFSFCHLHQRCLLCGYVHCLSS